LAVFFVLKVAQAYVAKAAEATGKERVLKELIESVAAKAAGGLQNAGSKFDFEVFALPGGSVIAVALWCWSMALMMVKSSHAHSLQEAASVAAAPVAAATVVAAPVAAAEAAEPGPINEQTLPVPGAVASRVDCTWRGAHCT
jgi:hypothetical protein